MLRKTQQEIADIIFESISDGVFTVNQDCRITAFNKAAERISGFTREEAIGQYCFDIFHTDLCQGHCALRHTLSGGTPVYNKRVTIITKDGRSVPINVQTMVLRDQDEKGIGAVEFFRDLSMIEDLEKKLEKFKQFEKMVSCNERMQQIFNILPQIAESECNVLIQGPSGSGKELLSEAIHKLSPRKEKPYIKINCVALPETLLESELFGYVKGAFTDARRDKPGLFLLADGGTLLLDEIGEMPVELQSKLLRVLNNGEFQPLGSTRTLRTTARIISATNCDLEKHIREGRFRQDLYYRINVINLNIPPLKDRIDDIPLLVEHFILAFKEKYNKLISGVSTEVMRCFSNYDFPGNVRELENALEHAFVLCNQEIIELHHLPERMLLAMNQAPKQMNVKSETSMIREALERNEGNRSQTAKELGLDRTTLWRKMKRYNMLNEKDGSGHWSPPGERGKCGQSES